MDCVSASSGAISDRATYVDPTIDISTAGHERYINCFVYLFPLQKKISTPHGPLSLQDLVVTYFYSIVRNKRRPYVYQFWNFFQTLQPY